MNPPRIYIVGTDTEVGKTTVTATLARCLTAAGHVILPYKPAQSGTARAPDGTPTTDAATLVAAAGLPPALTDAVAPHRYDPAFAPGLLHDVRPFVGASPPTRAPLDHAERCLADLEATHRPQLTLIEGAGGLWVPMPGGTWQPEWISRLATHILVVARPGLGTINHTLLTVAALRSDAAPVLGIVFSMTERQPPPRWSENADVITAATGLPFLGALAYRGGFIDRFDIDAPATKHPAPAPDDTRSAPAVLACLTDLLATPPPAGTTQK